MKRIEERFNERAERINNIFNEIESCLHYVRTEIYINSTKRKLNENTFSAVLQGTGNLEIL